ncbi:MAG: hypothetical protein J6J33_05210 [Clostridia bacterium]|nr:hypothetical protein [Clostridia bacterium]
MIKEYINKPCKITIALGQYTTAGSAPLRLSGIITGIDNEYVSFEFDANDKNTPLNLKGTSGKMLIKRDYLISIVLA